MEEIQIFDYKGHKCTIGKWGDLEIDDENSSYSSFLEKLNPQLKWIFEIQDDYQGEWFAVGSDDNGNYFYHKGSFGSCSGCDWLQSIGSESEAIEFLKEMEKILSVGKKEQAIEYLIKEKQNLWDEANDVIDSLIEKLKQS